MCVQRNLPTWRGTKPAHMCSRMWTCWHLTCVVVQFYSWCLHIAHYISRTIVDTYTHAHTWYVTCECCEAQASPLEMCQTRCFACRAPFVSKWKICTEIWMCKASSQMILHSSSAAVCSIHILYIRFRVHATIPRVRTLTHHMQRSHPASERAWMRLCELGHNIVCVRRMRMRVRV